MFFAELNNNIVLLCRLAYNDHYHFHISDSIAKGKYILDQFIMTSKYRI